MKSLDKLIEKVSFKENDLKKEATLNNKPINLGFESTNVNTDEILSYPPGHTVYRKVNKEDIEIAVEESINK